MWSPYLIDVRKNWWGPLFILVFVSGALWLLHRELAHYHLRDIEQSLAALTWSQLGLAMALTCLSYVVLVGYDWIAVRAIGQTLPLGRIALASFLGYSASNNFGTLLGATTIRLRMYTAWGLSAIEIVKLLIVLSLTFWVGLLGLSAAVFLLDPLPIPERLQLPLSDTRPLGLLFATLVAAYFAICAWRRRPLEWKGVAFQLPSVPLAMQQLAIATLDLTLSGSVLYVCLPMELDVSFGHFLAVYLLALVAAVLSHVPGGLGVLELVFIVLLKPEHPERVIGSLLAFRVIYYLMPLAIGTCLMGYHELAPRLRHVQKAKQLWEQWANIVAPRFLALSVFVAGVVLLLSGATPAQDSRIHWLRDLLPLPVIEISHMLGSVAGVLLLLLARSLQRRIETAYYVAIALLVVGIFVSILKGFDYEEALLLSVMLLLFLPSRSHYFRHGRLFGEPLSASWLVATIVVLACTAWLMAFAFKHVEYKDQLWWKFAFDASAPRSLRAMAGAVVVALVIASSHLLKARPKPIDPPSAADLETVRAIVAKNDRTMANLALAGDKYLLFSEDRQAFIMYGVEGRSWVSLCGPFGDDQHARELIWDFREMCEAGGCWPVFYQIDVNQLPLYVEMGMTLIKLGEEARVPIKEFSLEGSSRRSLRKSHKHMLEDDCQFEILPAPIDDQQMQQLKQVSDAWLGEKTTAEKSFSMGSFVPEYVRLFPIAVLKKEGRIVAFANIWRSGDGRELSVDLMRHLPDAPRGSMEFLFVQMMMWGREQGFEWFNIGMAPLSGVEDHPLSPLWNRLASFAFRHGEHFYNFQGLRQYKEKFDPVWSPRYLASPGGLALPRILANLATLISGGLRGLVRK